MRVCGPVSFDHDCREGICGACSLYINGRAHGPDDEVTTCQLHMRKFHDGDTITIEPWRSKGFPVIKDLVVDRQAFDKILQAGGFVSVGTGGVPDGNAILISHETAEESMDGAACCSRKFSRTFASGQNRRSQESKGDGCKDGRTWFRCMY